MLNTAPWYRVLRVVHTRICCFAVSMLLAACCTALLCLTGRAETAGVHGRQQPSEGNASGVAVVFNSLDNATRYTVSSGDCSITWIAYNSALNRGIIKHSASCPAPLALQLPLLKKIGAAFFSTDKNAGAFRTLFWGGLVPEKKPASLEMPLRLALAASKAPEWDAAQGKPHSGDLNGFVKKLADREPIYQELQELFAHFQRNIAVASVEKVRVLQAAQLPFYDRLAQQGVRATDQLPFDCMVWFCVSEATQN